MKISELNTNTFLNNDGSPENSYLLINYAATQGAAPTTQKVSLDVLSKAVAAKLNLPIAVTDSNSNVTGLQRVRAVGNGYQIENLNASFSGNDSGGGNSTQTIGFDPVEIPLENGDTIYAYPLFYIPHSSTGSYMYGIDNANYNGGNFAILGNDQSTDDVIVKAIDPSDAGYWTKYPTMGGGESEGNGNGNGNAGC